FGLIGGQDGTAAEQAEGLTGQAVAEVRIALPRAGLIHERERDRQCSHGPGLRWHPVRVISSHPRSITPAEPTRLGTPARMACTVPDIAGITQLATAWCPSARRPAWDR